MLLAMETFNCSSQGSDSLFISQVKDFVFKEMGVQLEGQFYTHRDTSEEPLYYIYVSLKDRVEKPFGINQDYTSFHSKWNANVRSMYYHNMGYSPFMYLAYCYSDTPLNARLLSYRKESVTMIAFHELMHNYISQFKLDIPYDFNESTCDIIGNYGALKYAKESHSIDLKTTNNQLKLNEKIYTCMNAFITKINADPKQSEQLLSQCQIKINKLLKHADKFQNDRFNYDVNTGYLLKNQYYSKNYFLLKKVFLKQKSMKDFLEIINHLPANEADCQTYLKRYL
jgi:hypothetical protein